MRAKRNVVTGATVQVRALAEAFLRWVFCDVLVRCATLHHPHDHRYNHGRQVPMLRACFYCTEVSTALCVCGGASHHCCEHRHHRHHHPTPHQVQHQRYTVFYFRNPLWAKIASQGALICGHRNQQMNCCYHHLPLPSMMFISIITATSIAGLSRCHDPRCLGLAAQSRASAPHRGAGHARSALPTSAPPPHDPIAGYARRLHQSTRLRCIAIRA